MFDSFKKEYYGIDSLVGRTQVNFPAFKTLFPILVFDVRKQNEKLKTGVTDIQVKLFFNANVPANTNAYQCYYRELERNKNENDFNIVLPNEN